MHDNTTGAVPRRILVVFGTRPEAIKLAPVIRRLRAAPAHFACRVCVTGQHREMLADVLPLLGVRPDEDLHLMRMNQRLPDLAAASLTGVTQAIDAFRPDTVIVHGDTATGFAAALAGFYAQVPVAHVEAGLRTWNLDAPFPEEANRQLIARVTAMHFAPTARARDNLLSEGIPSGRIWVTGNTGIDSLLWMRDALTSGDPAVTAAAEATRARLGFDPERTPFVLVTGHRRENFGAGMADICRTLRDLAAERPELHIVYPVHLNPNVREPVRARLGDVPNVHLIPPVDYPSLIRLMDLARLVLTDSGGIQEEAPSLGKPVLVMRETTERPEALDAGTAMLVGTDPARIRSALTRLLDDPAAYRAMSRAHNPFGDGQAAARIAAILAGESPAGFTAGTPGAP